MRPLAVALLAAGLAAPLSAEDPPPKPERREVAVESADPDSMAKVFTGLSGESVKGLPGGWNSSASIGKDPFFQALAKTPGFQEGARSVVVVDGEFKGVLVTHDGKSFLYRPGQPFAVESTADGSVPTLVMKVTAQGGVEVRTLKDLNQADQAAALAAVSATGKQVLPNIPGSFDGSALRGDGVFLGGKRVADSPAPSSPAKPFKPVTRPKGEKLPIVNEYKGALPTDIKPGQIFWDGKTLMAAEAAEDGGGVRARAVGYMADMKRDPSGDMVFWHGGAAPDKKGAHSASRDNWSLLYVPKLEKHMESVDGNNTAHHVAQYAMMDLSRGKVLKTPDGPRIDLTTALQDHPIVWRLPPANDSHRNSLDKPETKALFRFGAPVTTKDRSFQSFIDMRGNTYQEQESRGRKYIVRTGTLYNLKEPKSPSDLPRGELTVPILVAPVERPDPPPDPFAAYSAFESKLPAHLASAAKALGDNGFDRESGRLAKELPGLETSFGSRREGESRVPGVAPTRNSHETVQLVKNLAKMNLTRSDDIVKRTEILRGALAHDDPFVRIAAADALAASGEYGRDARHVLAATALMDVHPDVRAAAALALPKVDPSGAKSYAVLPQFAQPQPRPPVNGPQEAGPAPLPPGSPLVRTLKLPQNAQNRGVAVRAEYGRLMRLDPASSEAAAARKELAGLLDDAQTLTRAEAAGALLILTPDSPDAAAVRALSRFLEPDGGKLDPGTRAYYISGLAMMRRPTPQVLKGLRTVAADAGEDREVRTMALKTLFSVQPNAAAQNKLALELRADEKTKDLFPPPERQEAPANFFDRHRPPARPTNPFELFLPPR